MRFFTSHIDSSCLLLGMSAKVEPQSFPDRHVTVRMKDCIVVFCSNPAACEVIRGTGMCKVHEAWTYNLWTEQWRKYINQATIADTLTQFLQLNGNMCGVAIGSIIYMYSGGLWEITRNTDGSFDWNKVCVTKKERPSPRRGPSCWEYENKMWIFGGFGESPVGYLNDHGDFAEASGTNNQLLSHEPSKQTWKNVEYSGEAPSPCEKASAARINDRIWLYG